MINIPLPNAIDVSKEEISATSQLPLFSMCSMKITWYTPTAIVKLWPSKLLKKTTKTNTQE